MNVRRALLGLVAGILALQSVAVGAPPPQAGADASDLAFTPLDVCSLFDVRLRGDRRRGEGVAAASVAVRGSDLSDQGGAANGCGVPEDALAVLVHVRAMKSNGVGSLRLWGAERPRPAQPLLRYEPADSEMSTVVPLCQTSASCPQGELALEATAAPVRVIIDVAGYFRRPRSPLAGFACAEGKCVTGFDDAGAPQCAACAPAAPEPTDCELSDWSAWSPCSTSCGAGIQLRNRIVLKEPSNGGQACGALQETRACQNPPCPVDCVVSEWSPFGPCSTSCGPGTRARSRSILQQPSGGGAACPALFETQACSNPACPVDCVQSEWSAWSACSASCGGGVQTRTRATLQPPANGGKACGPSSETQACNTQPCPQ